MNRLVFALILLLIQALSTAAITGDIDSSGTVDLIDIQLLSDQWLNAPGWPSADIAADPNTDGFVDAADFSVLASHWMLTVPDANEMAWIPGGAYEMGNHFSETDNPEELPVHSVQIDAFYLGRREVTNGQYCDFLNASLADSSITVLPYTVCGPAGSDPNLAYCALAVANGLIDFDGSSFSPLTKGGRDMSDDPVVYVSWYGAAAYCNWRSKTEGYSPCYDLTDWTCDFTQNGYRLPTEAEWEYAARSGQASPYLRFGWGDTIDHDHGNYYSTQQNGVPVYAYDLATLNYDPNWNDGIAPYTAPTGSYPANSFGLYDMAGNVYEWCHDWYDADYYSDSPTDNPTGPDDATGFRCLRGGSWYTFASSCRNANRARYYPQGLRNIYGFRLCLDLE